MMDRLKILGILNFFMDNNSISCYCELGYVSSIQNYLYFRTDGVSFIFKDMSLES